MMAKDAECGLEKKRRRGDVSYYNAAAVGLAEDDEAKREDVPLLESKSILYHYPKKAKSSATADENALPIPEIYL